MEENVATLSLDKTKTLFHQLLNRTFWHRANLPIKTLRAANLARIENRRNVAAHLNTARQQVRREGNAILPAAITELRGRYPLRPAIDDLQVGWINTPTSPPQPSTYPNDFTGQRFPPKGCSFCELINPAAMPVRRELALSCAFPTNYDLLMADSLNLPKLPNADQIAGWPALIARRRSCESSHTDPAPRWFWFPQRHSCWHWWLARAHPRRNQFPRHKERRM